MTPSRLLLALLCASASPVRADNDTPIFRFKEYLHPVPTARFNTVISPDGKLMAGTDGETVVVWDARTGNPVTRFSPPGPQGTIKIAFAADGKSIVSDGDQDTATRFWELKTGKQLREQARPAGNRKPGEPPPPILAFDPGTSRMVSRGGRTAELWVFDLANAKPMVELKGTENGAQVVFSPDGKVIACASAEGGLRLIDAGTGKSTRELIPDSVGLGKWPGVIAFSPNSHFVAAAVAGEARNSVLGKYLTVWAVADGKRYCRVFTDHGFTAAAFGPDERTLAAAGGPHGLYLYDLATDTLHLWSGLQQKQSVHVVGSSDGASLAVVAALRTGQRAVFAGAFPRPLDDIPLPGDLSASDLREFWEALLSENEFVRRRASEVFKDRPAQALTLAGNKVKPVPDLYRLRALDLIENLGNPDIRDRVEADLDRVAHEFAPLLEERLKKAPAGAIRTRLDAVVKRMRSTPPPKSLVESLAAIWLLEQFNTPASNQVLVELAVGTTGARVTEEAAAAVKRAKK